MKMDDTAVLVEAASPTPGSNASAEVFQQLGHITRQLHDTLSQLGVMPKLQVAAEGLPDARSRLNYIAEKTGAAANKVLNSVDQAKSEHAHIAAETRRIAQAIVRDPIKAVASGAIINFVGDVEASTARTDHHLTEIMMAQDFHDLTGQVIKKVVALAATIEEQLLQLLLQAAPQALEAEAQSGTARVAPSSREQLAGPVVNPEGRTDVVASQQDVDDLLSSLGF